MFTTIQQSVTFLGVSPRELFESYLDADRHSTLLGAPVSISDQPGGQFWVFGPNAVRGQTLLVHRDAVIVQAWRADVWRESDPDSVLTLTFAPHGSGGTQLQLTQAVVPDHAYETIATGWHDNYWRPWQANLAGRDTVRSRALGDGTDGIGLMV